MGKFVSILITRSPYGDTFLHFTIPRHAGPNQISYIMKYADGTERPEIIERIRGSWVGPAKESVAGGKPVPDYAPGYVSDDARLLDIKTANQWIHLERHKPVPKRLFGNLWLEGELCMLFADTNLGKSILAVQLADSLTSGQQIGGFEMETKPSPVLYIDFELSSRQFQSRYTDERGVYQFKDTFYRAEVDLQATKPPKYADFTDYMAYTLHRAIKNTGAQIIIIDNITCMGSTEQSGKALAMMRQLKLLKTRHELSILVLAHTPKRRPGLPLTRNDLGGSKQLINFADSAFAMGESNTRPGYRYLKQVKQRAAAETYGADRVCLMKLERKGAFIGFELTDTLPEHTLLSSPEQQERERLIMEVRSLHSQGYSQRDIAARLRFSLGLVNKLVSEGEVVRE